MKKKKNNKMKMTIAAGLLITPAIVAQAGEVQASETVNVDLLLAPFDSLNESSSTTAIETQENKLSVFNTDENTDGLALYNYDQAVLTVLAAKIQYLKEYQAHKASALELKKKMGALSTTSPTFIEDYRNLKTQLADLEAGLATSLKTLETAASQLKVGYAPKLLTGLTYFKKQDDKYDHNQAIEAFLKATITESTLKTFDGKSNSLTLAESVINDSVKALGEELQKTETTESAINEKLKAVKDAIAALTKTDEKNIVNNHQVTIEMGEMPVKVPVKTLLTDVPAGFKTITTLNTAVTKLTVSPPTSATTLKSSITTIENTFKKIPTYLQHFVPKFDDSLQSYRATLAIVEAIDATIANKDGKTNEEIQKEVEVLKQNYKNLGTSIYQDIVTNYPKLTALETALEKIKTISATLANTETPLSLEAVNGLLTDYKEIDSAYVKFLKTEHNTLLKDWTKNIASATKIDTQITALSTEPFATMGSANATKKKSTTDTFIKNVENVKKAYDLLPTPETGFDQKSFVKNSPRLKALIDIAQIAKSTLSFTALDARSEEKMTTAQTNLSNFNVADQRLTEDDRQNLPTLKTYLDEHLNGVKTENETVADLIAAITALGTKVDLVEVASIRERYDALSKTAKDLVSNYSTFQTIESQYKAATTVTSSIEKIDVGAKDFISKTTSAKTAYDKLPTAMKEAVPNASTLTGLYGVAELMSKIDKLRPNDKTFRAQLEELKTTFTTLTTNITAPNLEAGTEGEAPPQDKVLTAKQRLLTEYGPKLTSLEKVLSTAEQFIKEINDLNTATGQIFMNALTDLTARYKGLDSGIKANITNSTVLTNLEKDYNSSLKVYKLIENLPVNTDKSFPSKVTSAEKAYQNLSAKQRDYVYNYTTKLAQLVKPAEIIARIDKLKVGSKTYEADVKELREQYKALTAQQQGLIHNITKLDNAEKGMSNAEEVIKLIDLAIPTAEDYIKKLIAARDAYDALPKIEQKLVTNYKELQTRERAVKPVLKLDNDILALDPSNAKTFISKYKSAQKAYEKLKMADRGLLTNVDLLTGEKTSLYNVINAISSIKNSSKTFVEDTKNARSLYDAIAADLKAKVSNYAILQGHELNVEGGKKVDAMIQALNSSEPKEFIANVKAAREAYKALSSANKKAVTLEAELKAQEKYIKPVETAIKAIDDLSNPSKDLSRQFTTVNKALQKLDDKQMTYISNMDKYSNLSNVIHTYTMIAGLKSSDKYYQGNIEAAKTAYDRLSEEEKMKVTNYYKLQEALLDMSEVQKVTSIISSLNPSTSSYFADVEKAQAAYKELPSGSRKQVLNYSILKDAEKDMKTAQKVVKQIDDLDPTLRTYESKAKSAKKAYDKLNATQKQLIYNYNKLQAAIFELGL